MKNFSYWLTVVLCTLIPAGFFAAGIDFIPKPWNVFVAWGLLIFLVYQFFPPKKVFGE